MPKAAGTLEKLFVLEPGYQIQQAFPPHTWQKSPNHSERLALLDTIVIHCTAGASTAGALGRFLDAKEEASSHIIIPDSTRSGEPTQTVRCVEDSRAAWHVRKAVSFQGRPGVNSRSLGIEIVNTATADDPYTLWQVEEAARWCRAWMQAHPTIRYIVTHAYLDPTRRSDPCVTFPWDKFLALVMAGVQTAQQQNTKIKILFAGKEIDADTELHEGATWAELRPVVEALGFRIAFDPAKRVVSIEKP